MCVCKLVRVSMCARLCTYMYVRACLLLVFTLDNAHLRGLTLCLWRGCARVCSDLLSHLPIVLVCVVPATLSHPEQRHWQGMPHVIDIKYCAGRDLRGFENGDEQGGHVDQHLCAKNGDEQGGGHVDQHLFPKMGMSRGGAC